MGRPQQRENELKKASNTYLSYSFIDVSNVKRRKYLEEDQHLGECSDDSTTAKTDQEHRSDSEEVIDLSSENELLPPSQQHQPDESSLSTECQAVVSASPPPSSSVCETTDGETHTAPISILNPNVYF